MGHKWRPTEHQRQIRFLMFLIGAVMVIAVIVMMLVLNAPVGGYHFH
jgi:Tfp pilus assembly protein PilN